MGKLTLSLGIALVVGLLMSEPSEAAAQGSCWDCEIANPDCQGCGAPGGLGYCMDQCTETHGGGTDTCTLSGSRCIAGQGFRVGDVTPEGTIATPAWIATVGAPGVMVTDCRGLVISRGWTVAQVERARNRTSVLTL
jgi:hypothetical protein